MTTFRVRSIFCFTIAAVDHGDHVTELIWSPLRSPHPTKRRGPGTPATTSDPIPDAPELTTLEAFVAWVAATYDATLVD